MWNIRLLPLLAVAAFCLFALKSAALMFGASGGLTGATAVSAQAAAPEAKQADAEKEPTAEKKPVVEKKPSAEQASNAEMAARAGGGEATPVKDTTAPDMKKAKVKKSDDPPAGTVISPTPESMPKTEADLLQSLADRRRALDKQARELELRENLLKAAEQRVEARITELKAIEARIESELKKGDEERDVQFAGLVKMYSGMKPKIAAEVFNKLDMDVLMGIVSRMNPRAMGPILAAMDPLVAQRLTIEIANRGQAAKDGAPALPKITGQGAG